MTDAASILTRLILLFEAAVLLRPLFESDAAAIEFCDEVDRAVNKPCENERLLSFYLKLATVLLMRLHACHRGDRSDRDLYCALAGVLLPRLRADLGRAIEFRRESM